MVVCSSIDDVYVKIWQRMITSESRGCVKMIILSTLLLSALSVVPVHSFFEGTCLRKEPSPGVLVLPQGSKLLLGCRGQVKVNGVKVTLARANNPITTTTTTTTPPYHHAMSTSVNGPDIMGTVSGVSGERDKHNMVETISEGYNGHPTVGGVYTVRTGENGGTRTEDEYDGVEKKSQVSYLYTDPEHKAPPTAPTFQPTRVSGLVGAGAESDWWSEEMDSEGDYEEEEDEEAGDRVTRGLRTRPQWKWNGKALQEGWRGGHRGDVIMEAGGRTLFLSSVREANSGKYSCHHRGKMLSSLMVVVADPPERPYLSCYKKSPSSKIRCDWTPSQPISVRPQCSLLLSKGLSNSFSRFNCTYSRRLGRCWCALDHDEEELRVRYNAYLCVTSTAGNATSSPLVFRPLEIVKPDPPSAVVVRGLEGQERTLKVSWGYPCSWKTADYYYKLHYEISYRPVKSQLAQGPQYEIERRSYIINDALPGVEYLVQLRAKEEYEGHWSDWSTPVYARTWTAQLSTVMLSDDLSTTMSQDPFYTDSEGSGTDDNMLNSEEPGEVSESAGGTEEVWHHVLWISGSCVLLSVTLAAYLFRHKDRVVSKLQSLSVVTPSCTDSAAPDPAPTPQEGHALVTFAPPPYKEPLPNEVEEEDKEREEEEDVEEGNGTVHFNNTSYFLVQRDC